MRDSDRAELLRRQMREWCKTSLYYLCKTVLGMDKLAPHVHKAPCAFLDLCPTADAGPADECILLMPRDYFKSSLASVGKVIQDILRNPSVTILIANEKEENAKSFLRTIRTQFEKNGKLQWLFPELIPDIAHVRWSDNAIVVRRPEGQYERPEATVEAIGVGGTVVSRHYSILVLDDLVGKAAMYSPLVMREAKQWVKLAEHLFADNQTRQLRVVGTRWGHDDIYREFLEREGMRRFVLPSRADAQSLGELHALTDFTNVVVKDDNQGVPTFPEKFPVSLLEGMKAKEGSALFSCMMQLNPINSETTRFKESWLNRYTTDKESGSIIPMMDGKPTGEKLERKHLYVAGMIDPATSSRIAESRTAFVSWAQDAKGRKFLLDAWARLSAKPSELVEALIARFKRFQHSRIGFEDYSFFGIYKDIIKEKCLERGITVPIVPQKATGEGDKDTRIASLDGVFESGDVFIRDGQTNFLDEYIAFPNSSLKDILDATWYCIRLQHGLLRLPDGSASKYSHAPHVWHDKQREKYLTRVDAVTGYGA